MPALPDPGPGTLQSPRAASMTSYQSRVNSLLLASVSLLNPKYKQNDNSPFVLLILGEWPYLVGVYPFLLCNKYLLGIL